MSSVLSSLFSRDPKAAFPYELPVSSTHTVDDISIANTYKKGEPTQTATCFWAPDTDYGPGWALKSQAQKLKTLRHPNVLTYLDSIQADGNVYLITESCVPLKYYMTEKRLTGAQKEFVVSWGLFQLLNCLKFLHYEARLSHENLRNSVFVTEGGDWKLAGFEKSVTYSNSSNDLNSLALIMWELFNGFRESMNKPAAPGKMPQRLHNLYKRVATSQAAKVDIQELISDCRRTGGFFKNRFVDTLIFLDEFQLKDAHEKQVFFSRLKDELELFSDDIAKYRILPKLILSYEYGEAGSHVLTPLFRLGKLLDQDEYQRRIVPCLCKLFSSPDRTTRVRLLEKIDEFADNLSPQLINEKIYINIASGFMDTNPAVRESTVKAMAALADKLNHHNLNVDLMRHLARLQGGDEQPAIRTNATICLGKIGYLIEPQQRQKILISAFTRALKDPFPPSRMAAILALSATQQYYSLIEVANRVLPALGPITCDPEKQVRDQCFKALNGFIEKLEKASDNPESIPELEAQVRAGGRSGLLSSDKVPQWASWALKSLSGKFYKGSLTTENRENRSASEVPARDEKSQTVKPQSSKQSQHVVDDGWGDLEEKEPFKDEFDKWEDAPETVDDSKEDDGWDDGWQELTSQSTKESSEVSQGQQKITHTSMKLTSMHPTKSGSDDLDYLLGITTERDKSPSELEKKISGDFGRFLSSNDHKIDHWTKFTDDFGNTGRKESSEPVTSAWNDVSWGDTENKSLKNREARRAELAARNETRRKEFERKRLAKKIGATKVIGDKSKN